MEVAVAGLLEEVKEGVKVVVVTARGGMGSAAVLAVEAVRVRVAEATPPGRSSGTL